MGSAVAALVHAAVAGLYGFLHILFGNVKLSWSDLFGAVGIFWDGADKAFHWVGQSLYKLWKVWIPQELHWIAVHLLDPLLKLVSWVAHQGTTMWFYFTHPASLVDLIFEYLIVKLEATAWATTKKLGSFLLSLIVHHLDQFVSLIEDILDAVF